MITRDNIGVFIKNRKGKPLEFASSIMKEQDSYLVCMQQSPTSIAKVAVSVGESVLEGGQIGRPKDRYGCFVYSPTSGKVVDIIQKMSIYGTMCDHVLIVSNKKNERFEFPKLDEISRKTILERLMSSGILDLSGQPSYIKFVRKPNDKSRLFISCIDNDPFVSCEEVSFRENIDVCVKGAELYMNLINVSTATFVFSSNQKSAIKALKKHISDKKYSFIKIKVIDNVYPLSLNEITRNLSGKYLDDAGRYKKGIYIESGQTAKQLYEAVILGKPVISRLMTIGGNGFIRKANYEIKNGTSLRAIMDFVGGNTSVSEYKMICGGAMTGIAQESNDVTVNLVTPAVLFMTQQEFCREKETPCISCGRCVDVCPACIMPNRIETFLLDGDYDFAKKYGIANCTGCGACSYVCPAKRYLAQRIIDGRDKIASNGGDV